jgi:hypothetical protein
VAAITAHEHNLFGGGACGAAAGGSCSGSGQHQKPVAEPSTVILPRMRWEGIAPPCGCADFLRSSGAVRAACSQIDRIVSACTEKARGLRLRGNLHGLSTDEVVALAAYSHDVGAEQAGSLYFELNNALRSRGKDGHAALMDGWGVYMHYITTALARLPRVEGVCYRGYPDKTDTLAQYTMGRLIQWHAFSSTSTDFASTKGFTNQATGVIFKITVTDGRDIKAFSFFPKETEVLLPHSHCFTVTSKPYEQDGFTVIDLVQLEGSAFVS